jgi:hypothetical protein
MKGGIMEYTVRLEDNTVGTISTPAIIGETVNVHLYDENGNEIEKEGRLVEILEGPYIKA